MLLFFLYLPFHLDTFRNYTKYSISNGAFPDLSRLSNGLDITNLISILCSNLYENPLKETSHLVLLSDSEVGN